MIMGVTTLRTKRHITNVFSMRQVGKLTNLQRRFAIGVQYLRCRLDLRATTCINEFLFTAAKFQYRRDDQ